MSIREAFSTVDIKLAQLENWFDKPFRTMHEEPMDFYEFCRFIRTDFTREMTGYATDKLMRVYGGIAHHPMAPRPLLRKKLSKTRTKDELQRLLREQYNPENLHDSLVVWEPSQCESLYRITENATGVQTHHIYQQLVREHPPFGDIWTRHIKFYGKGTYTLPLPPL